MSGEEHTPYFSVRIRIADIKSPANLVGLKERTVEVTMGNTTNPIVYRNSKDVADVKNQTLKEMLLETFDQSDEVAKERGFTFMDKVVPTHKEKI